MRLSFAPDRRNLNQTGGVTTDRREVRSQRSCIAWFQASLAAITLAFGFTTCTSARAGYIITDLGDTFGGNQSTAAAINSSGQVAGTAYDVSGNYLPFVYGGGTMTNLGSLGGNSGNAYGINDSGQVVGSSYLNNTQGGNALRAFRYNGGMMQNLGVLPGDLSSRANAINDSGEVVGDSFPSSGNPHGFLYSGGQMKNLGTLGGTVTYADAINAAGQVVGESSDTGDAQFHAFFYNGTMHDVNPVGSTSSEAYGINNNGEIVGILGNSQDIEQAFIDNGTTTTDLGTLGGLESYAYGINDNGQVVGASEYNGSVNNADTRAFLYSNGSMVDLNGLIDPTSDWTLISASAINDGGQIVGEGINPLGQTHGFLLTPTPEPASAVVLIIVGLGLLVRRRQSVGS